MLSLAALGDVLLAAVDRGGRVPLLALGSDLPPERSAPAFRAAAQGIVRDGDLLAHGAGCYVVAMLAESRRGGSPGAREIRSVLERIAAVMADSSRERLDTGWWRVEARSDASAIERTIERAFERGREERERHAVLATVGHELRTPLTSIRGYIETLLEGAPLDARTHRRFLETARQQTLRLGRLVDGMLEFSMLDLTLAAKGATCDVAEQVGAAIDAMLPLAGRRAIRIESVPAPAAALARVDADACMHALLNLLDNAVKHGREGGRVVVACTLRDRCVQVTVDDDGCGIPNAQREDVFRMGVRGRTTGEPGRGIGLAVVRAVAQRCGGSISLQGSSLGGARFELNFPRLAASSVGNAECETEGNRP